jgi:hypothetical protein
VSLSYDLANVLGIHSAKSVDYTSLGEIEFQRMVSLERRRATRSQKSSLLMLIDMSESAGSSAQRRSLHKVLSAMRKTTRETDITGWYKENSVVGVMFTEITFGDHSSIPPAMMSRLHDVLKTQLTAQELRLINIDFHFLSEPKSDVSTMAKAYAATYSGIPVAAALTEAAL